MEASPFQLAKDLEAQLRQLLSSFDIPSLPRSEQDALLALKRQAAEVRLDMRDYGLAETAANQQRLARDIVKRLRQLEDSLLQAGGLGLIGPADIAQASATLQQLMTYV